MPPRMKRPLFRAAPFRPSQFPISHLLFEMIPQPFSFPTSCLAESTPFSISSATTSAAPT